MKKKNHLTREQRYQISALLQAGHSQKEIAEIVGKDKSVISRELKRNRGRHGYHAGLAQEMADERKERLRRPRKFTDVVHTGASGLVRGAVLPETDCRLGQA